MSSRYSRTVSLLAQRSILIAGLFVVPLTLAADDWHQWRGVARDGKSTDTGLLDQWPEGGPPLVWRAEGLGLGYSSVAVADGKIFTLGDVEDDELLFAVSDADGKTLWSHRVGPANKGSYGGSRSTPTVDGKRVYALGSDGDLVAVSATDGKEIWRLNIASAFGGEMMIAGGKHNWRFSESPLIDGKKLIVTPGARAAALVALDKNDGKEIWRSEIPDLGERGVDGAAYSSIVVSEGAGIRQYVQLIGRGLIGVEASTGKFLWGYNRVANHVANCSTPLVDGDYVFASTGYGTGAGMVRLRKDGDRVAADEIYFVAGDTMQNHHGGMVLHNGVVYSGTGHKKGFPLALDMKSGEVKWGPIRNAGTNSAAVSFADGRLYFRYEDGLMVLIEANSKKYIEAGSFMIPDVKSHSWSAPVISGGKLYLKEQDHMLCYDLRRQPKMSQEP
jgi:outer membrane protein assembly factor BamB